MARTYADAIEALNTLQSNFAIVNAIRNSGRAINQQAIPEMREWCRRIGYEPSDFNRLNAIHVAGTKGKGSTSAFVSSILTQFIGSQSETTKKPLSKIGLYTSPHLRFVRERIQINNLPLTEAQFAHYFFEIWDRLEHTAQAEGKNPKDITAKPVYFRFLTLMAFHTYISEDVDGVVIECGVGGKYDSTNIIERPIVTGVTRLGIDHVGMLGDTIGEIAWHKAGIMKPEIRCFTVAGQKEEAMEVLYGVAREVDCELEVVEVSEDINDGRVKLGLQADFQKGNASLAVKLAEEWLRKMAVDHARGTQDSRTRKGLEIVQWPGRCETRKEGSLTWCIDSGHTLESIEMAGTWFAEHLRAMPNTSARRVRCLIFNQQTRDADSLAKALQSTLATALVMEKPFTHAVFCTNTTFRETGFRPDLVSLNTSATDVGEMRVQNQLAQTWKEIDPSSDVKVVRTIEEAVDLVRGLAGAGEQTSEVTALVTGSLHLVGGFLEVIETKKQSTGAGDLG